VVANRREKLIAIVLAAALAWLLGETYLWTPYKDEDDKVKGDIAALSIPLKTDQRLVKNRKAVDDKWKELLAGGLKTDPAAAESQALHAMRDFAQNTRIDLQSLKPERIARTGDFQQIRIQATGNGTTSGLANMIWQIENARIPLRVTDLRLTARKEGTDDLSFSLNVATIAFTPAPETRQPAARTPAKGESR
jgi:hypothetical protein